MANISSINGNPIVVGTDGIADEAITSDKTAGDALYYVDAAIDLETLGTHQFDLEIVQGFKSNPSTQVITNNLTLLTNKRDIKLAAGNALLVKPNGLYVTISDVSTGVLTGVSAYIDGVYYATIPSYVTAESIYVSPKSYDMVIRIRIGKDSSHSENITPEECDLTAQIIGVEQRQVNYGKIILGSMGVVRNSQLSYTVTFSDDSRIIGSDGVPYNLSGKSYDVTASRTTLQYVVYDVDSDTVRSEGNGLGTNITRAMHNCIVLFAVYAGDILQFDIPIRNVETRGGIVSGAVFAFVSGDGVNVITDSNARAVINNKVINISGFSTLLETSRSNVRYLTLGADAFHLRPVETTLTGNGMENEEIVVALVYANKSTIVPIVPNLWANTLPIDNVIQREGIPTFFNNDRIGGYEVTYYRNNDNISDYGRFLTVLNGYSMGSETSGPLCYVGAGNRPLPIGGFKRNQTSIANKTILCIGDSVTRRGWYQERILTHEPTVNFIGTYPTLYGSMNCEGYSGRKASDVLGSATIAVTGGSIDNPFWDASQEKCDFAYYCNTQDVHPDYVIIEFGLNETDDLSYANAIRSFIATIKSYDPSIIVYVLMPFQETQRIGLNNHTSAGQRLACDRCILESWSFEDCVLIPCWYIMVDEYDYNLTEKAYGYGSATVTVASDGVHPSESVGFAKLGDQIYSYLGVTDSTNQ